jgi:transforming growth factor-beta-induced protein
MKGVALGLLFGACTVSVAPATTPAPTLTAGAPASAMTTTAALTATTAPLTAPSGVTSTTPSTGTGLTTTGGITGTGMMTGAAVTTATASVGTIAQVISATANLQTLASALTAAGMMEGLEQPGPFTLFAPTDDAFAALPGDQAEALLNDPTALATVLQYHLVIDQVTAEQLMQLGVALSSSGQPITITLQTDGLLLANNVRIVQAGGGPGQSGE